MFSVQYYNTLAKKGLDLLTKNNYILMPILQSLMRFFFAHINFMI